MLFRSYFLIILLFFVACSTQKKPAQQVDKTSEKLGADFYQNYSPTELPIYLEKLTPAQTDMISALNDEDTTTYYVKSRPVFSQVVNAENNADETRTSGPIFHNVPVFIYALGEMRNGDLVDYGWIENWEGETIWKMTIDKIEYAGGDHRNVKCLDEITLPPGRYHLHYSSNGSHAYNSWEGEEPENSFNYGITVFNTKGIELINSKIY